MTTRCYLCGGEEAARGGRAQVNLCPDCYDDISCDYPSPRPARVAAHTNLLTIADPTPVRYSATASSCLSFGLRQTATGYTIS